MTVTYDDYQNTATAVSDGSGTTVTRTIYLRAADEIAVLSATGCPARGDVLTVGSLSIYCDSVTATALSDAAGDGSGLMLYQVTAVYSPIESGDGVVNKARWSISFRPQSYTLRNVAAAADQSHYGMNVNEYPEVTTGINVNEDGAQGVEVDEMVEVLTIEFWKDPDDVGTFLAAVRPVVDTTNNAAFTGPWGTYATGEARITGLSVASVSGELSSISVEISRSKNVAAITTYLDSTGATTTYAKDGWEYAWIRILKGNKAGNDDVKAMTIDAHVATVYKAGDFSALGVSAGIFV